MILVRPLAGCWIRYWTYYLANFLKQNCMKIKWIGPSLSLNLPMTTSMLVCSTDVFLWKTPWKEANCIPGSYGSVYVSLETEFNTNTSIKGLWYKPQLLHRRTISCYFPGHRLLWALFLAPNCVQCTQRHYDRRVECSFWSVIQLNWVTDGKNNEVEFGSSAFGPGPGEFTAASVRQSNCVRHLQLPMVST